MAPFNHFAPGVTRPICLRGEVNDGHVRRDVDTSPPCRSTPYQVLSTEYYGRHPRLRPLTSVPLTSALQVSLLEDLRWRGLVHQSTDQEQLAAWLAAGQRTLYCGFDPTSDSLHVGSLLPARCCGGFRSWPSADRARRRRDRHDRRPHGQKRRAEFAVAWNSSKKTSPASSGSSRGFLDFDGRSGALLLNNHDWMRGFSYLDFLRDMGKHFPVNVHAREGLGQGPPRARGRHQLHRVQLHAAASV